MGKIKTKDTVKDIKVLDKTADVSTRMKETFVRTKERTQSLNDDGQNSANEYAENQVESGMRDTAYDVAHGTKDGTKMVARKGKEVYRQHKGEKRTEQSKEPEKPGSKTSKEPQKPSSNRQQKPKPKQEAVQKKYRIKTRDSKKKTIKQSARSAEKQTIKTTKSTIKQTEKTVKTAEKTTEKAIKTAEKTAKAAEKAAKASAKAAQKTAQAAKESARVIVKAVVVAVKGIAGTIKGLVSLIIAGGWVSVVVIAVIALVGLIAGSCYGIFFSGEDSGTGQTIRTAVEQIDTEYDARIQQLIDGTPHDVLEMSGSRAAWKEVLSLYAVKVTTDSADPQEVATMDDTKQQLLNDIFWEMHTISARSEIKTDTIIEETDDGAGNIIETAVEAERVHLYITVSHKSVDEMAAEYGFDNDQRSKLDELLSDENIGVWTEVLSGITESDGEIVRIALSQLGNVGGEPYWSWYGFGSRVEWCACFVSWCANECGYIDRGIVPKFAGCENGMAWFRERGRWLDGNNEPTPGMLVFFDWTDESGVQDGNADHVGIVQKVMGDKIYTVEGNSGDTVRVNEYDVGHFEIIGFGTYSP